MGFNTAAEVFLRGGVPQALGVPVVVTTADGSRGVKGFVTAAIAGDWTIDSTCACGPEPMLKALYNATDKPGQYSFEARMACGFGGLHGLHLQDEVRREAHLQGWPRAAKGGDRMVSTAVTLCGVTLDNPVIPASGTFGFGQEFTPYYDINVLGSLSFKGTTQEARFGNPTPRIAECPNGMLNSVGLQNPGIDHVIAHELPAASEDLSTSPIMANISGFSLEEYVNCCARMDAEDQVAFLEVNISCPNVRHGGMAFGTSPEAAAEITRAVKAVTHKPVIMKLSPNVTDIVSIAKACEDAGADGLSLINTLLGMRIDLAPPQAGLSERDGRLFRPRRIPGSASDGVSGHGCGEDPRGRHGRRFHGS